MKVRGPIIDCRLSRANSSSAASSSVQMRSQWDLVNSFFLQILKPPTQLARFVCKLCVLAAVVLAGCTVFGKPSLAYDVEVSLIEEGTTHLIAHAVTVAICSVNGIVQCKFDGTFLTRCELVFN